MKTFRYPLILSTALLAIAGAAHAQPSAAPPTAGGARCAPIDEQQVAALFDRWNASLRTLDPAKVAANYTPDAVLLATVANAPRTTPAEIKEYFAKFLPAEPQGTIKSRTIRIGCNTARDMGTYDFRFKDGHIVKARYTYDYELRDGKWLIAHHHSSVMPETVVVPEKK
ncbi:SgcJ/EcaC family oxidoreductase [Sphingomonas sp. NCPPB 2930]